MQQITITVQPEGAPQTQYTFEEFPVLIGRHDSCHLSICHAAIPRQLCTVWYDASSNDICLEEKPNLTNLIYHNDKPVKGGIRGPALNLTVGPIGLVISPGNRSHQLTESKRHPTIKFYVAAGSFIVLLTLLGNWPKINPESQTPVITDFPVTICPPPTKNGSNGSLLAQRAQVLLQSDNLSTPQKLRLVALLNQGHRSIAVATIKDELHKQYRLALLKLFNGIRNAQPHIVSAAATEVLPLVQHCKFDHKQWLQRQTAKGTK